MRRSNRDREQQLPRGVRALWIAGVALNVLAVRNPPGLVMGVVAARGVVVALAATWTVRCWHAQQRAEDASEAEQVESLSYAAGRLDELRAQGARWKPMDAWRR